MRTKTLWTTVLLIFLLAGAPSAADKAPLSTAELRKTIGSGKKSTLIFFQNPQGGPCRIQNEILQKLLKDRKQDFNLASVSTQQQEDMRAFYDYGVRSLPTVVIVDKDGRIARYFPPGIQSYETLTAALNGVK